MSDHPRRRRCRRSTLIVALLAGSLIGAQPAWAQAPQRGGTLNVALDLEIASLDPYFGNAISHDRNLLNLFYENLFVMGANGELHGRLATDWTFAEDGKSITFNLRDGITFHDGTPFNAEAVKYNLDRLIDEEVNTRASQYAADLESTEMLGPMQVRVNLKEPSGSMVAALANEAGMIASPSAIEKAGEDFHRDPVGTGPFEFVEWIGGDSIKAKRNPNYWREGEDGQPLPYLDEVTARFINNTAVKIVEAKAGNLHLTDVIQVKDFGQVEDDPGLELAEHPQGVSQYVSFNNKGRTFGDNPELRRAVALAINRPVLEKVISRGYGSVNPTWVPKSSWAYSEDLPRHTHDPEMARQLYEESGHSGPLTISVIQRDPDTQIAQLLQAQLAEVGIQLEIEVLERQAWLDKVLNYNYELATLRNTVPRPDPDMSFGAYYSRGANANYSGIEDEALFQAIDDARTSLEIEERKKHYAEAQRILLDNHYQTYLFTRPVADIKREEVQNLEREFSSAWLIDQIWLSE